MDVIVIHRGIVIPRGKTPENPLAVKNPPSSQGIKGGFFLPSSPSQDSIDTARKRALKWTERYTINDPSLEPLVINFKLTRAIFDELKGRFAIFYLNLHEEPIQTFDWLVRETPEAETSDPSLTFNGEGLTLDELRKLELVIGRRNSEGDFVYKPYDEYIAQKEGNIKESGEKNV